MTQQINKPFNSNDAGKLFVFALLIIPPTILIVGIIPFLFLLFGVLMLRKSGDFDHIETASHSYWIFCVLAFFVLLGIAGYLFLEYMEKNPGYRSDSDLGAAIAFVVGSLIPLLYIGLMEILFLRPLRANRDWIAENFSVTSRGPISSGTGEIDIIKGERLRSFSVADELLKWAKLKEDGHITEFEFSEARRKLLERK